MAPLPPPPVDICRVAVTGAINTQPYTNVMWLRLTNDGTRTVTDLTAVITSLMNAYNTRFAGQMRSEVTFGNAHAVWITPGSGEIVADVTQTHAGTVSGGVLTSNALSYVLDWNIGAYYRGGHPRTYLPGVSTADLTGGSDLTGAKQTALATAAIGFKNDFTGFASGHISAVELGTLARYRNKVALNPPVFYPYQGASVRRVIGIQKRRLGK